MAGQGPEFLPGLDIPEPGGVVPAAAERQPAIGGEGQRFHASGVAEEQTPAIISGGSLLQGQIGLGGVSRVQRSQAEQGGQFGITLATHNGVGLSGQALALGQGQVVHSLVLLLKSIDGQAGGRKQNKGQSYGQPTQAPGGSPLSFGQFLGGFQFALLPGGFFSLANLP